MNVFKFLSIHAGDTALLLIGKPVKRFMVNTAMTLMETLFESPAELFDLKPGVVYEIPNDYGYPNQFNVKNKSVASITPKIYVLEFGDVVRSSQPLPPPPPPPVVELDYIVADKLVKEYEVGQTVNYDDITVIAHYTDGSTADVSAEATIGTISTETAGDKTLSVCYSEDEITDCTGINIEVVEPEPPEPVKTYVESQCAINKRIGGDVIGNHSGDTISYAPVTAGTEYSWDYTGGETMYFFENLNKDTPCTVVTQPYTPTSNGNLGINSPSDICTDIGVYYYE